METETKENVEQRGLDVKAMIKKLENCEFKVVADLFSLVNNDPEKEAELVDLFARYYEKVGKSQEFLCWAVEWEVERTENPTSLFRLESVATNLLYRHFFSDDGMYCLETSVCPLIEKVTDDVLNSKEDLSKKDKYILNCTKTFLSQLETSSALFPVEIREALRCLKKKVKSKFADMKNAVGVVLFLRFLCPTILQPASFGIIEEPLKMEVYKVLLPIAKLLQCIANETYENKILESNSDIVINFIKDHIQPLRNFTRRLTNKQEIQSIKKMIKPHQFREEDKITALNNVMEYISGPEFPMPSLEVAKTARVLPTLLKKRKVISLDNKEMKLDEVLDTVKINLVYLFPDVKNEPNIHIMNEACKIKNELDKLGVKQIVIITGTVKDAIHWSDNTKFKGEVIVDSSGKIPQLFSLQKRKSTRANLYTAKMLKIRSKLLNSNNEGKQKKKTEEVPVKIFVLFGDRISFESKFRGEIQDLLNLLQACGASPEVIATNKKRLKKKRRLSFFASLRRTSVKSIIKNTEK